MSIVFWFPEMSQGMRLLMKISLVNLFYIQKKKKIFSVTNLKIQMYLFKCNLNFFLPGKVQQNQNRHQ